MYDFTLVSLQAKVLEKKKKREGKNILKCINKIILFDFAIKEIIIPVLVLQL